MTNVNLEKLIAKAKIRREKADSANGKLKHHSFKHGQWGTRLYRIFIKMKDRCYSPTSNSYKYYGERGIKICNEWLNDFEVFYKWR
jgi:hypothetical protein